jgi:ribosomal protein L32
MVSHRACLECGMIRRRSGDLVQAITIVEETTEAE